MMTRITRFVRSNYVTPLSKSINSRHMALEPLCCIQSCKIRSGCLAVGIFEGIGVFCILAYSLSELKRIFISGKDYTNVRTYADYAEHPSSYALLVIVCFLWIIAIILFLAGVRQFHARLIQMFLGVQVATSIICFIILIAVAIQVALPRSDSNSSNTVDDSDTGITSTVNTLSTVSSNATITAMPKRRMTEQLGLFTCSIYLLAMQTWGISVVYDCYKYFKLCQVLVNLAANKGKAVASGDKGQGIGFVAHINNRDTNSVIDTNPTPAIGLASIL